MDIEAQIGKVNQLKEKMEMVKEKKIKLGSELESYEKNKDQLEKECQEKFSINISELEGLIETTTKDISAVIAEVEEALVDV